MVPVEANKNDATTPTTADSAAGVRCDPAADAATVTEKRSELVPIVEADDREEAGYGYGV